MAMTRERSIQLYQECAEDLAYARRIGHKAWIATLTGLLYFRNRLVEKYQYRISPEQNGKPDPKPDVVVNQEEKEWNW